MSLSGPPTFDLPKIQLLAGFGATSASYVWTDISGFLRSGQISRPANRLAGPLYQYQAATFSGQLKNGDGRFDPDNICGPYVTTQGIQAITETFTPSSLGGTSSNNQNQGNANPPTQATGTFTVPANLSGSTVTVKCWAAGGGGGTGSNISKAFAGGGGGGGEFAQESSLLVTAGKTYSFAIGLGGAGAVPGNATGATGADTTFTGDSVTVHAHGGTGGGHGNAGSGGVNPSGGYQGSAGTGGTGSTNSFSNPGGAGGMGGQNSAGNQATGGGGGGSGGPGGGSGFSGSGGGQPGATGDGSKPTPGGQAVTGGGPGGTGGGPNQNGSSPSTPPGGGGGGGAGEKNGGTGAPGQITITYTIIVAVSARTEVLPEVPIRVIGAYALNQTVNFENGIGTWAPNASTTAAVTTAQSLWGQSSLQFNITTGSGTPALTSELIPIPPGMSVVSASAWFYSPTGAATGARIDVNWFKADQSGAGQAVGTNTPFASSGWTLVTNFNLTPPATAAYFQLNPKIAGSPNSAHVFYMDQAVGAPGPACGAFPLFTGHVDAWTDTGIINPNDTGAPQTGNYQGYSEVQVNASDAFGVFALANLAQLTTAIDSGDDAGGRIALVLSAVGWPPSQQNLETSATEVQGTQYGDTVLDLIQTAALTDGGDVFVDGAGNVTFFNRQHILRAPGSITPQAIFGDRPGTVHPAPGETQPETAGTELPYAGAVRANDNTTLFNDIQITPASGTDLANPTMEEVTDPVSIAMFLFPRVYTNSSLIFLNQQDALNLAQAILFIAKDSEDRVDQLVIDPQRDPADLYYQVLGRQFTDMIEFRRRPPGLFIPIVKPLYIRGVTHSWDFSAKTWQTVWATQDANKYGSFLRLDDPDSGRLDYNSLAW